MPTQTLSRAVETVIAFEEFMKAQETEMEKAGHQWFSHQIGGTVGGRVQMSLLLGDVTNTLMVTFGDKGDPHVWDTGVRSNKKAIVPVGKLKQNIIQACADVRNKVNHEASLFDRVTAL